MRQHACAPHPPLPNAMASCRSTQLSSTVGSRQYIHVVAVADCCSSQSRGRRGCGDSRDSAAAVRCRRQPPQPIDGCVDGASTALSTVARRRWLNSWRGGKGASLRPVSLGRSSVHPGACGNHGTWPVVASLGLTLTLMLVVDLRRRPQGETQVARAHARSHSHARASLHVHPHPHPLDRTLTHPHRLDDHPRSTQAWPWVEPCCSRRRRWTGETMTGVTMTGETMTGLKGPPWDLIPGPMSGSGLRGGARAHTPSPSTLQPLAGVRRQRI